MILLQKNGLVFSLDNGLCRFSDGQKSELFIPAAEYWVVFWLTAAFLDAASRFELMGVSLFDRKNCQKM